MDSLQNCLTVYYNSLLIADLQPYLIKEKYKVLKWLPTVGYDAFRNSPIITFSFNSISGNIATNQINKAKILELELKYKLILTEKLQELETKYKVLKKKIELINHKKKIFEVEKEMFLLQSELYANHQISPKDFLVSKINFYEKELTFKEFENSIFNETQELFLFSKCK